MPDDGQVVRDEEERNPQLVLQVVEQVDHSGLNGHVEGGDRFVEDQQLGLEHQGPGDADPLALTAGELVGVAVGVVRLEPHQLEHLAHPLLDGRSAVLPVDLERLRDGLTDGQPGVE